MALDQQRQMFAVNWTFLWHLDKIMYNRALFGKCALLLLAVVVEVGSGLASGDTAIVVSDVKALAVSGGFVDSCSTQGQVNADGWNCPATGDLACGSRCNPCSAQDGTDKATCEAVVCWACGDLNPAQSIKRCQNTGGPGCTDFNGAQACGPKSQKNCTWDSTVSNCLCGTPVATNFVCQRRHCSQP